MGYTQYWEMNTNASNESWKQFTAVAKRIVEHCNANGVVIVGGDGESDTNYVIDENVVIFNGLEDDSHETFYIGKNEDSKWNFCKTARKPYDIAVVACLVAANKFGVIKGWSSDGDAEDHNAGYDLFETVLTDREELIDNVINQIRNDLIMGDTTAIAELLQNIPTQYLQGYLPE